jgi:hypothetical protein
MSWRTRLGQGLADDGLGVPLATRGLLRGHHARVGFSVGSVGYGHAHMHRVPPHTALHRAEPNELRLAQ